MKKTKQTPPNPIFCKFFNRDPAISETDSDSLYITNF